jgi:DNA-binding FadR family transcriptional regulator
LGSAAFGGPGLTSVVTARLRQMITEGLLAPGTRLNERILCEQLTVSRTPLRESLKTLAVEGLVELLPNRGAIVAQISIKEIEQTFEVMKSGGTPNAMDQAKTHSLLNYSTIELLRAPAPSRAAPKNGP